MLRNYFKTAWRNLLKNKLFSVINVAGLSVGIAACLLILQYVSFHLSFDRFNKNADDLYRVTNDRYQHGKLIQHGTITYSAIGKAMQHDFPEVINHARVLPAGGTIMKAGKKLGDQWGFAVDNSFLQMFSYPWIAGDEKNALTEPNSIVLTETMARNLFGIKGNDLSSIIGQTIQKDNEAVPYKITGICKDAPENSHLFFSYLLSYNTVYKTLGYAQADYDFSDSDFWHYIQLKPGTDYKTLEAKLDAFSLRHFQGNKVSGSDEKFLLQPLTKAHLYSDYEYEIGNIASARVVWSMAIVAALIILIAWVNYINLATAKSVERAKEVGVRKVTGATKAQLVKQFLTESFLINLMALGIAWLLVFMAQQPFNDLIQQQLSLTYLFRNGLSGFNVIALLITVIGLGIFISGFYPAFVLSSFKPILVLKGKYFSSAKGINLRRALVVTQFAITVALIIGSLVVYRQMRFVSKQSLGVDLSQVLIVRAPQLTQYDSTFITKELALQNELKQIPHVINVANSWSVPGNEQGRDFDLSLHAENAARFTTRKMGVSPEYIPLYNIKLKAGRNFDNADYHADPRKVHNIILNENACRLLGFKTPQEAVGKQIHVERRQWDVVGVIADFHQKSLRYPLEPLIVMPLFSPYSALSVKVNTTDIAQTMATIKAKYDEFFPGNIFDYYFLDDRYNQQYANDLLFGKVFGIFSAFAVLIACLGLLGLSLFTTVQRTKEIGVRKVLGASIANIVVLLSKDFIRLVIIAFVIASPVAWTIMNNWLNDFAYRIDISAWIFIVAGSMAVIIALATISFQAIKAALANPVKSLRTE
jgi:putative ABC transport system permease protein